ncbi:MAG: hypothetical protein KDD01_06665 [Phaeodactylibacter sp.]|nr:hypothetical protein [Phaeodactylibacter sp.]
MHEKHYTNLLEQLNTDLDELESAQQFIQHTTGNVNALKERIGELVGIADGKSQQLEMLLVQIANLGHPDSQAGEDYSEAAQLQRQSELEQELSSYLEELEQSLNGLYTSVEELSRTVKERNEALLTAQQPTLQKGKGNISPHELQELQKTIEEGNQEAYSQMFLLNEQQIKLLSGQNRLLQNAKRNFTFNIIWYPALGVGILLTLALCLTILVKGQNHTAEAVSVDEELSTAPITAGTNAWSIDSADAGLKKAAPGIASVAAGTEGSQKNALGEDPLKKKTNVPNNPDEVKVELENKPVKSAALSPDKSDSLTTKGLPEEPFSSQLLPPERAKIQIAPKDEYAIIYLKNKNFDRLALKYIHSEKGVHFLPFGLKTPGKIFSTSMIKDVKSDSNAYHWGGVEGIPLEIDFQTYYDNYIFDEDFSDGAELHYNEISFPGNSGLTAGQIAKRFPDCIFVEFCKSGKSLVLVFEKLQNSREWGLSAIIHNH